MSEATSRRPWLALQAMLAVQVLASLVMSTAAVLAPAVAPALGLAPERVGLFVAVAYLCAMTSGLRTGHWVARIGGVRVSQCALVALASGALMATLGHAWAMLLGAVLVGVGYGLANPSAAAVLGRHVPSNASGLFFSMKQAGVPIGVALTGLLMPLGLYLAGWRITVAAAAVLCVAVALLLMPTVRRLDADHVPHDARLPWLAPLREVWASPHLRHLGWLSLVYAMAQQAFVTFLVSLLHLQGGLPLAAAAGILSASQVASTFSRVGLGHLSDRRITPLRLLGWLGLAMGVSLCALAAAGALTTPGSAMQWMLGLLAALAAGATAMGWNGVFFAALVRSVPRERLAVVSGATQFFTFAGGMVGPFVFAQFVSAGGSYAQGMALAAVVPVLIGVATLRRPPSANP